MKLRLGLLLLLSEVHARCPKPENGAVLWKLADIDFVTMSLCYFRHILMHCTELRLWNVVFGCCVFVCVCAWLASPCRECWAWGWNAMAPISGYYTFWTIFSQPISFGNVPISFNWVNVCLYLIHILLGNKIFPHLISTAHTFHNVHWNMLKLHDDNYYGCMPDTHITWWETVCENVRRNKKCADISRKLKCRLRNVRLHWTD